MKYLVTAVIMLTVAVYSNTAFAWDANQPYIKVSVGQFNYATSAYFDVIPLEVDVDDDTIALDANVGFPFTDTLAIEGGFSFLTEANWSQSAEFMTNQGLVRSTINGTVDAYALTLAIVSRLSISNNFGFLGKVGAYHWEAELTETYLGFSIEDDDTDVLSGIGVDFRINKTTSFVAGWDVYHEAGNFVHFGLRFNL